MSRQSLGTLVAGMALLFNLPAPQAAPLNGLQNFQVLSKQALPEKPLRGYGSLAGNFVEYATPTGGRASLTVIQTPSSDLAGIVLAKYNSDFQELGRISVSNLSCGPQTAPIMVAPNQGAVVAFRQNTTVTIIAAEKLADLADLLKLPELSPANGCDFNGGKVPVYLDTFDKFGFSFYYFGWETPNGQPSTYDFLQDFTFAKKYRLTLHPLIGLNGSDTAEGIPAWPRFEANVDLMRRQGIPAMIGTWAKTGPAWLMNLYPYQMQLQMPDYTGTLYAPGYDISSYGPACPAWSSQAAQNVLLKTVSSVVHKYSKYENVTEYQEPHEEVENQTPAIMTDYGPVADAAYRNFLQSKYHTVAAVAQRWHAKAGQMAAWNDIHVPEVAGFLGWGADAVDLKGVWHIAQEHALTPAELAGWDDPALDDSKWDRLMAPGDDHALFQLRTHAPGIFRRTFDLPSPVWQRLKSKGDGKIFLYVWDMAYAIHRKVGAAVNGTKVGEFENPSYTCSWCAFDVANVLRPGTNQLALQLPFGELSYKIYLSPHPPRCYPDLDAGEDARWVDFRDFVTWTRADSVCRGMESIRREDPNRFIRLSAPGREADVEKSLAEDFGGQFHDTGGMSGTWEDELPALMRSSGLPFTLEPGNGATDVPYFETFFGRWSTEGVNAVDYIYNMAEIQYNPGLLAWFDSHQPLIHLFGKYHGARASVAVLNGEESIHLTGFPWDKFSNELTWLNRRGPLNVIRSLPGPRDLILDTDFDRGKANKYKVIIDDNTLVMDDPLIANIEKWVRSGGIFITYGHSGQHSPLAANTWPISRLTGYRVIGVNDNWSYEAIPGQTVLKDPVWAKKDALGHPHYQTGCGLFLQKEAPECEDVLAWERSKGIALGVRPLGHGYVITDACCTPPEAWPDLLRWCGISVAPLSANLCRAARFVSNNGLDEIFVVWGENVTNTCSVDLTAGDCPDQILHDILTGQEIKGTSVNGLTVFRNLVIHPLETRAFLAPRHAITSAPLDWLNLQRDWWQGTRRPAPAPPTQNFPNTLDLSTQYAFSPVPETATNLIPWVATDVDDRLWPIMDLGIWSAARPEIKRAVFRRQFEIRRDWKTGRTWLWLNGWDALTLRPPYEADVFLDGKPLWHTADQPYANLVVDVSTRLSPGTHVLAMVTAGNTTMNGFLGNAWLEHLPEPNLRQSLSGHWGPGIDLPGTAPLAGARKTFTPLPAGKNSSVMLFADGGAMISKIFINGHWLSRSYGLVRGDHFRMNLTPYIRWNAENELELCPLYPKPATVSTIEIRYYDPKQHDGE